MRPFLLLLAVLGLILASGCGGSDGDDPGAVVDAGTATQRPEGSFEGGLVEPRQPAPALRLPAVGGGTVDIRDHRGKVVLVSFVYSQCPDTCPLIMQMLKQARDELGPAADEVEIVLVSTDPEGDTPAGVRSFLANYDMTGKAAYLVGSRAQLEGVWERWGVAAEIHAHEHDDTALHEHDHAGLVEHTSLTYGVSADGRLTTAYPVNFPVASIVHDVPLLAVS